MSSPYDPYHDEDAFEMDVSEAIVNEKDEAVLAKTFKQMGDVFKNGGFCSPRKEVKKPKGGRKSADSTATSVSDESQDDVASKVKSVSFYADPLIIKDSKDQPKSSFPSLTIISPFLKPSKQRSSGDSVSKLFSFIPLIVIVSIAAAQMDQVQRMSPALEKVVIKLKGIELSMITKSASYSIGSIVSIAGFWSLITSDKVPKSIREFIWGAAVYGVIISGIYYVYGL